jgi:hypothetical protein
VCGNRYINPPANPPKRIITQPRAPVKSNICTPWLATITLMSRAPFTARIEQLQQYAQKHGHTDIPYAQAPLGHWVGYVRRRNKAGLLTAEQIAALEQVPGWTWEPRKSGARKKEYLHLEVHELRSRRLSLQQIADITRISRQRVHQILKEMK